MLKLENQYKAIRIERNKARAQGAREILASAIAESNKSEVAKLADKLTARAILADTFKRLGEHR